MKVRTIMLIEPAGVPPEHTISIGKSGVCSMEIVDSGVLTKYSNTGIFLIPWGNIRHAQLDVSSPEPKQESKRGGFLKKAA